MEVILVIRVTMVAIGEMIEEREQKVEEVNGITMKGLSTMNGIVEGLKTMNVIVEVLQGTVMST